MRHRVSLLCCCLAALPLAACAGSYGTAQPYPEPLGSIGPSAQAAPAVEPVAYAGPASPAAVLVFLPGVAGADAFGLDGVPPGLWTSQGLGVVMPRITDAMLAEQADMDREIRGMLAQARAVANAPLWLVGPGPQIQQALETLPAGAGVSGVVMTSMSGPSGTCSRTVTYSSRAGGAPPVVRVSSSGNDCRAVGPGVTPPVMQPIPQTAPSRLPHAILVRNDNPGTQAAKAWNPGLLVQQIADRIKAARNG